LNQLALYPMTGRIALTTFAELQVGVFERKWAEDRQPSVSK
jgi:hypothetical protein